ncbi:MAG: hypothetical protein CO098_01105 [Bacteroidetes bacterium CG_4_9_14_3_um_filter_41_19]|nr:MAG: hypothetical protein CO098_01105 [Bacteroidetes bacterium CG_4_9_14_3_um_filter_41_19]
MVFYPYKNFYPTVSYPQENWSSFYKAGFTNDHVYPHSQIVFNGVDGISVKGCSFENLLPYINSPLFTTRAINSYNSGFRVSELTMPDPDDPSIPTTIKGFEQGIYAITDSYSGYIHISTSVFEDNERGIYLCGISNPAIVQNEFLVRTKYSKYEPDIPLIGLYMDAFTTGFTVEENTYYSTVGYTDLKEFDCAGITVNNTGQNYNELYNNYFDNLTVGIAAGGENRSSEGDGLCIKCNDFSNCLTDIYVAPLLNENNEPITGPTIGIAELQGKPGNGETKNLAGNTFSNLSDPNLYNFEKDINCEYTEYFHHDVEGTDAKVKPLPVVNITVTEDNESEYDKELACPSNLGSGTDPLVEKSTLSAELLQIIAYTDTLNTEVDGGNTDQLNLDVSTSNPNQTIQLRQQLLDESPYLSDTVMKSAIDKENVLPNAVIRDVLTANPQSAKSVEVIQSLDNRIVPMPDYMLSEVMQGLNTFGAKEVLEQKLAEHRTNYIRSFKKIERYYQSDTSDQAASVDSIVSLWSNQAHLESKYKLAFHYLSINDSSNLFNELHNIPVDFDLSIKQQNSHDLYEDLFGILWQMNNDTTQIDSTQIASLIDISDDYMTAPGVYALNSLINKNIIHYNEPVYFPEYLKSSKADSYNFDIQNKEYIISVFPNPAGDYCIIDFDLSLYEADAILDICDSYGHKVSSFSLQNIHSQKIISLTAFSSGVYFVTLSINNSLKESHKLIITK